MELDSENNEIYHFGGEYEHGVDDKGRVVLPQEFRRLLGDEFVISRGPDLCLWLLPIPEWEEMDRWLRQASMYDYSASVIFRLFSGRQLVKLDPQLRLTIPSHLRDYSGINKDQKAVLVGQGKRIEIWNKPTWTDYSGKFFVSDFVFQAVKEAGLAAFATP